MVFGMSLATYTLLHVLISLIGIGSGLVVMYGLLKTNLLDRWTALFLATTVLTSISGFGFPFTHLLPSRILGIMSLVVLAFAIPARYVFHLAGAWRWIYVVGSGLALYFQCVCSGRAVVRKGFSAKCAGSHPERAAISGGAVGRPRAVRGADRVRYCAVSS